MSIEISQTSQFKIKDLSIISKFGKIDIGGVFQELNIFDTMLMPCMSGNIVIRDAIGLSQKLYFDGSESVSIDISKSDESLAATNMKKTFRIYKQSDRKNINQTSEEYILHFVSEEFIYSLQQKINQFFTGCCLTSFKLSFARSNSASAAFCAWATVIFPELIKFCKPDAP